MSKNNHDKVYRVAVITSSDKGFAGEREDLSGPLVCDLIKKEGYEMVHYIILPDEQGLLEAEMRRICDNHMADLILTTGGTGFSARDCTPEATRAVGEKIVPGIPEAMRAYSLTITKRAMLSRAVSVIRGNTLIINLPGSPKSVKENLLSIISEVKHGLDILTGEDGECAIK